MGKKKRRPGRWGKRLEDDKRPKFSSRGLYARALHRRPCRWDVLAHELAGELAKTCWKLRPRLKTAALRFDSVDVQPAGLMLARGFEVVLRRGLASEPGWAAALNAGQFDPQTVDAIIARVRAEAFEPLLRKFVEDLHAELLPRPDPNVDLLADALADTLREMMTARCAPGGDLHRSLTSPLSDAADFFTDNGLPADPARSGGDAARDVRLLAPTIYEEDDGGEVKRKLLGFIRQDPWVATEALVAVIEATEDSADQFDDPTMAVNQATDEFLFRATRVAGKTPIGLLLERQPEASPRQRERLLRWDAESFRGMFLVRSVESPFLTATDVATDREMRIAATRPEALKSMKPGTLIHSRVAPWDDHWLLSGIQQTYGRPSPAQVADLRQRLRAAPSSRPVDESDPKILEAFEIQGAQHAAWVTLFGTDELLFDDGNKLRDAMHRFDRHWSCELIDPKIGMTRAAKYEQIHQRPAPDLQFPLPEDLLESNDVAVLFDRRHGILFLEGYGLFRSAFESDGPPTPEQIAVFREYLREESIEHVVFERLRARFPTRAEQLFRAALRDEEFVLGRDFEPTLRKYKGESMRRPPRPSITVLDDEGVRSLHDGAESP